MLLRRRVLDGGEYVDALLRANAARVAAHRVQIVLRPAGRRDGHQAALAYGRRFAAHRLGFGVVVDESVDIAGGRLLLQPLD